MPPDDAAMHSQPGGRWSAAAAQQQGQGQAQAPQPAPGQQEQQHEERAPDLLALPQYAPFTAPDFNAGEWTSRVLSTSRTSAAAQAEELRGGVRSLEGALAAAVLARHGELLGHARRVADAEAGAAEVGASLGSLQAAVRRVRAEVEGPYAAVRAKARQLAALHAAGELLRALLARLKATAKLRAALDAPPAAWDLAKAAKLLADVGPPDGGATLAGVTLAAEDAPFLEQAGAAVRDAAHVSCSRVGGGAGCGVCGGQGRGLGGGGREPWNPWNDAWLQPMAVQLGVARARPCAFHTGGRPAARPPNCLARLIPPDCRAARRVLPSHRPC